MNWHTQEQFDERMRNRRQQNKPPEPLKAWYHVACMNNWRDVFAEQASAFSAVGLSPTACVLGTASDVEHIRGFMPVAYHSENLREYETPTLQKLYEWCCENPTGSVLYVHTKGVSNPADANKIAWRRLMTHHVVTNWKENLEKLALADVLGVDWQDSPNYPHFSGNFWMARADWLCNLQSPVSYRQQGGPCIAGNPWDRMHAEMWIGSKPWHHVENLCCRNENLWTGNKVFDLLKGL